MGLAWGYKDKVALMDDGKKVRYDICHLVEHEHEKPYDDQIWEKIGTGKILQINGKLQKSEKRYVFYIRNTASWEK
tara:strand:+ start:260 stop:487 length:228 start_codon:yes stop_codon:yes gene_type:complete